MYNLIFGNSAEKLAEVKDESVDLTVTSPPYDDMRTYNGVISSWNEETFHKIADHLYRVTKPGGVVVWVVADQTKDFCESLSSFKQAIYFVENCGFCLTDTMLYVKNGNYKTNYGRYTDIFEYMFVFSKGRPKTFNAIKDVEKKDYELPKMKTKSSRRPDGSIERIQYPNPGNFFMQRTNLWKYNAAGGTKDDFTNEHPARFPEQLALDHIVSWSNEGDTVLDPFCGSGTTGKMALINKRNFIGVEMDPTFYAMSKKRLTDAFEVQEMCLDG